MKYIYTYMDENNRMPVMDFLKKADSKIRLKLQYQINAIQSNNQHLCEPHVKHFTIERYKMLYEFRIKAAKKIVRIIFCEYSGGIVLLHAFYKRDKRDTECALEYTLGLIEKLRKESLAPIESVCGVSVN